MSDQETAQASDQVKRLIELLDLLHCAIFQRNYLNPALEAGLIERTLPDKQKSPKQKYRLKNDDFEKY